MTKNHAWILARLIIVILTIFAFLWVAAWIFSISYPFWIATLLVWMFYPLVRLLRTKIHLPNVLAVLVVLLVSLAVLAGAITGLVFLIIFGIRRISEFIPQWVQTTAAQVQDFFNESIFPIWQKLSGAMDMFTPEQQTTLQDGIASLGTRIAETLTEIGHSLADGLTQLFIIVPTFLLAFLFIFIAFYFIGKDWDKLFKRVHEKTPTVVIEKARSFKNILRYRVFGFIRAQLILMFIASLIVFIGLVILKTDHALTIAMIVGIAEILPYLGSGTILIPWFMYMFFTGDVSMGIGLAIVYGVTVAVRQGLEPKVLSSSMNLNALAVLISLFAGLKIFGVVGVFLGPLALVIIVIFIDIGVVSDLSAFIKNGFKEERQK